MAKSNQQVAKNVELVEQGEEEEGAELDDEGFESEEEDLEEEFEEEVEEEKKGRAENTLK